VKLLLDTHYGYALGAAWSDLNPQERRFFETAAATFLVSAVSIWEIRLKWAARHPSGDRAGPIDPAALLQALTTGGLALLPLYAHHAAATLRVPIGHKDPFDEILLAQSQGESLWLLTRDAALAGHPLARMVAALEG
jgi:PIN domain nuclease of toxin-antitoxin system